MEQHGDKLNEDNGEEKEDQDYADGLQMQVLLGNDDLGKKIRKSVFFKLMIRSIGVPVHRR